MKRLFIIAILSCLALSGYSQVYVKGKATSNAATSTQVAAQVSDSLDARLGSATLLSDVVQMLTDTIPHFVFGGGGGNATDTACFTTNTIYGAFYNPKDTLVITELRAVLQGTAASVAVQVTWNDSLNVAGTNLNTSALAVTSLTTGTSDVAFANTKIPPGMWVWCKTPTVTVKPTFIAIMLIGYIIKH